MDTVQQTQKHFAAFSASILSHFQMWFYSESDTYPICGHLTYIHTYMSIFRWNSKPPQGEGYFM